MKKAKKYPRSQLIIMVMLIDKPLPWSFSQWVVSSRFISFFSSLVFFECVSSCFPLWFWDAKVFVVDIYVVLYAQGQFHFFTWKAIGCSVRPFLFLIKPILRHTKEIVPFIWALEPWNLSSNSFGWCIHVSISNKFSSVQCHSKKKIWRKDIKVEWCQMFH